MSVSGDPEKLLGRVVYGELLDTPEATNHRGRVYRVYDGAGVATTEAFDFEGHATIERRQLVADKKAQPDWSLLLDRNTIPEMATAAAPLLDSETFSASNRRDALGRVLTAISPDDSEVHYTYDEGGGLRRVELKHRGGNTTEAVIGEITYNARSQRERVVRGPTTTTYTYDPQTYRLARLSTIRNSDNAALQVLHYHYDPAGNITDIRDTAQQTVYFQNSVVEAANSYEYDALGRLIEATGREHATQGATQRTHEQLPVGPQPMTSDPSAMRRYTQRYTYDAVGNILMMQHEPASGAGWTRHYEYANDGNRLLATSASGDATNGPYSHAYTHDVHGNMTTMPHLAVMDWNHDDQLQHVTAGTQEVYFQYAGGIRSRKYIEHSGTTTEERIYLGPFEIYRKRVNGVLDLERESLHVSDGSGRVCIVETKTVDDGASLESPTPVWRHQLSNHLGSATTEVDRSGAIISHEEYHPYGTSAYRSVDASVDVSVKRYRYTGMERDEETSLEYHSARNYAPWLGRWTAADPIGLGGGLNRYAYVSANPVILNDVSGRIGSPIHQQKQKIKALEDELRSLNAELDELWNKVEEEGDNISEELWEIHEDAVDDVEAEMASTGACLQLERAVLAVATDPSAISGLVGFSELQLELISGAGQNLRMWERMYQESSRGAVSQATASAGAGPIRGQAMVESTLSLTGVGALAVVANDFAQATIDGESISIGNAYGLSSVAMLVGKLLPPLTRSVLLGLARAEERAVLGHAENRTTQKALPAASGDAVKAGTPKWVEKLPDKVRKQIEKAQLPLAGETPFQPKLVTKRGQKQIETATVSHGPRKGEKGRVDIEGRIWLRDKPHAGYPAHWDVQLNGGRSHMNVGFDGNPLKRNQ